MTTKEDELFLEILKSVDDMPDNIAAEHMLTEFAKIYKEKVQSKEFKANPDVWEMVKQTIPEYFL